MKEALWGVLIVVLGLFGIVVINIFQNVTIDNDRVYYLIKETTEASTFDAIDLTYYRLSGNLRIVEDKFVESLTRRFAENVTIGNYTITVEDINEIPPKISLRIRSGITSLRGEEFGIVNRVDAILETKYTLDEVLNFLDITEEEWKDVTNGVKIEVDEETGENICKVVDSEEGLECIQGDLMFIGFSDVEIVNAVCQDEKPDSNKEIDANYKVCDCGKWKEESEIVTANPVKVGNEWVYTWTFKKTGEVRNINESIKSRVKVQACTTAINEMIPNDIDKTIPKKDGSAYEPSADNSKYTICPEEGIKIPIGMKFTMHPNYIPKESVNRDLIWTSSDSSILSVQGSNPLTTCILNETYSNCFSKAIVTANKVGIAYVNVKTTRGQTSSCKVEVFDGNVESVSCSNLSLQQSSSGVMKRNYSPTNATNLDFTWSISDTSIATIDKNSGAVTAKKSGTTTVTVTAPGGKTGTCTLTVSAPPSSGGDEEDSGGIYIPSGSCSCTFDVYAGSTRKCIQWGQLAYGRWGCKRYKTVPKYDKKTYSGTIKSSQRRSSASCVEVSSWCQTSYKGCDHKSRVYCAY